MSTTLAEPVIEQPKARYKYKVPLLNNEIIEFPDAEPDTSEMLINHIDMDITEVCNLRCSYCYKDKLSGKPMSLETAKQLIKFLVKYSERVEEISISILGGEPLLAFDMLKKWVPWTRRYCEQRGKKIKIGVTTNGTLFEKKHHDFFRTWHIGLHLSIDGIPEVHDLKRKFANGEGSSKKLEENLPRIFSAWRTVHARCTIVPETVHKLSETYKYFCKKGFYKVAFALAYDEKWGEPTFLNTLEIEFRKALDYHWKYMKQHNRHYAFTLIDSYVRRMKKKNKLVHICGAGRGSLDVDIDGFLWPCHRLSSRKRPHKNLVLGNVFGGFNNSLRRCFLDMNPSRDFLQPCADCEAASFCLGGCVAANWQENGNIYDRGQGNCQATFTLYKVCREHVEKLQRNEPEQWEKYTEWVSNYPW